MTTVPLKIRIYGDPCLREKSLPVKNIGSGERMLIASMIATMQQAKGIGLAAPQIGINQRIFVVDVGTGPMAVVNPRIVKKSGSDVLQEGCLSIPEVNVSVRRPKKITFCYVDEQNREMEMTCEDLLARVIMHETDHLNGKLITDYASDEEIEQFKEKLSALTKAQGS